MRREFTYNAPMCLIVFGYRCHPEYRLILVANRDEFYNRATEPAHFWQAHPDILAGRDQQAGGTWLGINRRGQFAAVTNFREGQAEKAPCSRGLLTTMFLTGDASATDFARKLQPEGAKYGGFNLLLADRQKLLYCNNRSSEIAEIEPGIHALSNQFLDTPWPKSEHVKQQISRLISAGDLSTERLLSCLQRRDPFPDEQLPATGISLELERTLSAPFITTEEYGTRCSSILLWREDGSAVFAEQNYLQGGEPGELRSYQW